MCRVVRGVWLMIMASASLSNLINYPAYGAESCKSTIAPENPFVPPEPYSNAPAEGTFWYGSPAIWTALSSDGVWILPRNADGTYRQKLLWWREGLDWRTEPQPNLIVVGKRLDGTAPVVAVASASSAFITTDRPAMMMGMDVPSAGCWEFTGYYRGHALSFVVEILP